ncbi:MAG TPA: peptide MFS transporter, partial [Gammaproteobacteria bacterium]|nr:peptide MFS transporter [Gammaproteobacteria bacterium]
FLTEMWERFGFYVVQGMLVLYFTQSYGFSDDKSYTILGVFSALAYISPMIGGFIADRLLGFKQAIIWGGIFLSIGYAFLALSDANNFYYALATIVVGNGLFKPNISSLLGALYPENDSARDAGFTIFYIGINLGALLAGVTSGFIKDHYGWHAGFGLASIGILIGLMVFAEGFRSGVIQYQPSLLFNKKIFFSKAWVLLYCLIAIPLLGLLLQNQFLGSWLLPVFGIFLLFFIFILAFKEPPEFRNRLIVLNILIIAAVIFWMLWLQLFFSANLFIDRLVNKNILGFAIPTTVFYALESVFVIILGPFFAWYWMFSDRYEINFSPMLKFVFAIFFVGLAFITLGMSTYTSDLVNPLWIFIAYFLITVGELFLSPIGLSAVTLLSPKKLTGMMMGIWFVALGFGGQFAGILAKLSSIPETVKNMTGQLLIYRNAFFIFAFIAFCIAIVLFIVQLIVRKKFEDKV